MTTNILSKREQQVVALLADDLTPRQVGAKLDIETKTVLWHLDNARDKADKITTAGLIAWFIKQSTEESPT